MRKLSLVLSLLALVLGAPFALAACGGDDDDDGDTTAATTETITQAGGGGGGTISVEADSSGALAYTTDSLTASAGENTIEFDNPASVGHDVVIEDADGNEVAKTDVITDDTATTTANLDAGSYTFFCSVPGHREAGMEGTLTVK